MGECAGSRWIAGAAVAGFVVAGVASGAWMYKRQDMLRPTAEAVERDHRYISQLTELAQRFREAGKKAGYQIGMPTTIPRRVLEHTNCATGERIVPLEDPAQVMVIGRTGESDGSISSCLNKAVVEMAQPLATHLERFEADRSETVVGCGVLGGAAVSVLTYVTALAIGNFRSYPKPQPN